MTFTRSIGENRFETCVAFILRHETEYNADGVSVKVEHDKKDPGGTTKYGIDQRSHPHINIETLSLDQAKRIYFDGEWTQCRCSELQPPWDLAVLDTAVNVGSHRAILWLQEAVGVKADGFIGPKTIAAVNASTAGEFSDFINRRKHYYETEVKTVLRLRYLKGWLARVADLETTSSLTA